MPIVVFDVENTTYVRPDKTIDMSPFCPGNKLVSVGWGFVEGDRYVPGDYVFFHHRDMTPEQRSMVPENRRRFQDVLDRATLLVGHNVKHDLKWIIESGFTYDGPVYCTMVGEYLLLRGQKGRSLKLEALAEHYDVFRKKADLTRQYLDDGVQFDAIPMHIVEEYGRADVHSCAEVFIAQRAEYETPRSRGMKGIRDTAMEYTRVLTDMERAGIPIDMAELARVEQAYRDEKAQLERRLREIVQEVMGDRPCNLASPEQLSWVIYSRRLTDKKQWAKTFNCGTDWRGKRLRPPNMTTQEFATKVRGLTTPLRKQKALHCIECDGAGKIYKRTKKGELWKKPTKCKACDGAGVVYADLNVWAGFRLSPRGVVDVRSDGFATDAQALVRLRYQAEKRGDKLAVEFLTAVQRLNAVESYLSSFVGGIKRSVLANGILHPNLNQTITSTQRLSSTEPNFQNLPRGNKTPIRRVVVSRWRDQGGEIMEADYCVAPGTRILTEDLRWVAAKDIRPGQLLVGFDEEFRSLRTCRLRPAVVEAVKSLEKPCLRITTTEGVLVCSEDHYWVARHRNRQARWVRADQLRVGDSICRYVRPWDEDTSYDGGWMAGLMDGEGHVSGTKIGIGQKATGDNLFVLKRAEAILSHRGFNYGTHKNGNGVVCLELSGEQSGIRAVGMFRPIRLLAKSRRLWEGRRTYGKRTARATITAIERIGVQEVVAIQTSTKTFIAEGFLSHNCGLEFVTAGELADDPVIFQMKRDKIDPHKKTATIIYQIPYEEVNKDQRQDSKPHTFAPLYGATGSQYPEHIRRYYVEFPVTYPGVGRWHKQLQDEAIRNKMLVLPDGKQFAFPYARRQANGGSTFATQIKNWPVQYFATGSIVPLGIIRLWHLFRKHNLKSLIILTVHDSVVVDRHPDEPRELIAQLMAEALPGARDELRVRYGYNMRMPLDIEISAGRNWLDKEEVHVD